MLADGPLPSSPHPARQARRQPAKAPPPALPPDAGSNNTLLGLWYLLLSTLSFQTMNGAVRHLSAEMHPFEIAFFRSVFGVVALTPVFVRSGLAPLRTKRFGMHFVRGILGVVSLLTFFYALKLMPLAKISALFFSTPLFVTILAVIFLGEKIRARRITALLVGFAGMLVIIPPGPDALDTGALIVLASAVFSASSMICTKSLVRTDSGVTTALYNGIIITPFALVAALFFWTTPTWHQILWLAGLGIIGTLGHLAVNQAFKEAEVSAVMPAEFTKLIWAALIGYFAFGEIPTANTWVGGAMIFSAVTYIAIRERRVKGAATIPATAPPGGPPPPVAPGA